MTLLKGKFQPPRLKRPCSRCDESFIPSGKVSRLCPKCLRKAMDKRYVKQKRKDKDVSK